MFRCLSILVLATCLGACAGRKETFTVELTNATSQPISAAFTKQMAGARPAIEEGWQSPEDIAIVAPMLTSHKWGQRIEPGQTRVLGPIVGHFPEGVYPYVRVYAGDRPIDELLAVSRGDPGRVDIPLTPPGGRYVIGEENGRLAVEAKGAKAR